MLTLAWAQYLYTNSSAFPVKNVDQHKYILAARCCWFQVKYTVSIEQVLGSDCALLCEVFWRQTMEVPAYLLNIWFQFALYTRLITVSARQVLVQSSSSSRAHSKRVMNQTMFDVRPSCCACAARVCIKCYLPPSILSSSVWQTHAFFVPKTHKWFPLFNLLRSVGPGGCLIAY
jgi:hypothetical protein